MTILKTLAGAAVAAVVSLGAASAATFSPCVGSGFNILSSVSGATDCTISDSTQDFVGNNAPLTVNEDGFFGMSNWSFEGKLGVGSFGGGDGTGQSGNYDLTGKGLTGTVMLVFKSGNGTSLVGYILGALSGSWTTPYVEPPFDFPGNNPKDVSHVSVYTKPGDSAIVPLPAAGWLMLAGLGGIAALRRRK